jgi:cullin-associated NEDD8-dissociated protein 1
LEALVLRCPGDIGSFLEAIVQAGIQFIKYDPVRLHNASSSHIWDVTSTSKNYAGDDGDETMDDDDEEEDEDEAEGYVIYTIHELQV